jgi:hypothetical protein
MKQSTNKKSLLIKVSESFKNSPLPLFFLTDLLNKRSTQEIEKLKEEIEILKKEIDCFIEAKRKLDFEILELIRENNYLKRGIRKIQISLGEYRQPETDKHHTELYIVH